MRKLYFLVSRFALVSAIYGGTLFMSTSCINADYDLDKEIDLEMNLGGTLTVPLGSTKEIKLGDMLNPEDIDYLEAMENGDYKISMSDFMSVNIKKLGGEQGVSINEISDSKHKDISFNFADVDPFNIALDDIEIPINANLTAVDTDNAGATINKEMSIATGLAEMSIPINIGGYTQIIDITDIPAGVSLPNNTEMDIAPASQTTEVALSFGSDIDCPDVVKSVTNIDLSGSSASATIDVSDFAAIFNNFEMTIPSLEIEFPEGFVLHSALDANTRDANIILIEDITTVNQRYTINFDIVEYDKSLNNINGTLESINENIACRIAEKVSIAGTTKGVTTIVSDKIKVDLNADIDIADMTLVVGSVDIALNAPEDELVSPIDIEVGDMISSITKVVLNSSQNAIDVDITPISIASGLVVKGDDIKIYFPADTYNIKLESNITKEDDSYVLSIPLSDIVGGAGFHKSVNINEILFADGQVKDEKVTFTPDITMNGTNLNLSMGSAVDSDKYQITLSEYKTISAQMSDSKTLTVSVATTEGGLEVDSAEAVTTGYEADIEVDPIIFSHSEMIDEQLVSIDKMNFTSDVFVAIDIEVELDLDYANAPKLSFNDYTIKFPNFLKFAPSADVDIVDTKDGYYTVVLNDEFAIDKATGHSTYNLQLEVDEINFENYNPENPILSNGQFNLEDQVTLSGGIKVSGGAINSDDFSSSIGCNIAYKIDEMQIGEVYGEVSPDIATEDSDIDLSELANSLEDIDLSLVLNNPTIEIVAENTLQIPLEITTLTLQPSKDDSTEGFETISISKAIHIDAAQGDSPATTHIYISSEEYKGKAESGVQYITMKNLSSIINGAPDLISISYEAGVPPLSDGDDLHVVDLNKDYSFKLDYALNIPLAFDELEIEYNTPLDVTTESLADVTPYISAFELDITANNSLPLELTIVEITPRDANGNALDLDPLVKDGSNVLAASGKSVVKLSLANNAAGDIDRLAELDITIAAKISSTVNGGALNANQSISFSMVARVPNGVTINPDEM